VDFRKMISSLERRELHVPGISFPYYIVGNDRIVKTSDQTTSETLREILLELKKLNEQMAEITGNRISEEDTN
jgi:hypothetical protein